MLLSAVGDEVESFRALLPVGYAAGIDAYRSATADLRTSDLTEHYTAGLGWFRGEFVPALRRRLEALSGGVWSLDDYEAFAAGSDVDLLSHLVNAATVDGWVQVFEGDWYGFRIGAARPERVCFGDGSVPVGLSARPALGAMCVPSVRNGHLLAGMVDFVDQCDATLLNLNLWPTVAAEERRGYALALRSALPRALLSISFSRGFGLTASQLGVLLVHREHPLLQRLRPALEWFTYFHNAIAARAFLFVDPGALQRVDDRRREWVAAWLTARGLPAVTTGSYYVRAFRVEGEIPTSLRPLVRHDVVRLCFKPKHLT